MNQSYKGHSNNSLQVLWQTSQHLTAFNIVFIPFMFDAFSLQDTISVPWFFTVLPQWPANLIWAHHISALLNLIERHCFTTVSTTVVTFPQHLLHVWQHLTISFIYIIVVCLSSITHKMSSRLSCYHLVVFFILRCDEEVILNAWRMWAQGAQGRWKVKTKSFCLTKLSKNRKV